MQLDSNSLIMQWNTDINGNPVSKHIAREVQQISPTHNLIQLTQIPDEFYPLRIVTEDNVELKEVKYRNDITETTFCVDYGMGLVYFDKSLSGKFVIINYYGRGVMLISDSRIFHKNGDTIADTWDNILERSQDALDLIETAGGLANAIKVIDQKVEEGTQVADRLEDFITETQFYGYTITLSREAFVVKADDNGEVGKTETSSVYTDVVVYQGAKQIVPTLTISNEYGCTFKVAGQRVSLATIDVNLIKVNAVLNIDCGDGLVAKRVLEVTKVFDGVNQYQVSMTNPFYSFQANSEGYIEEDQSVECSFKVSKANIGYENYTVQVQNLPQGLNYQINKGSVVFTAIAGRLLPSSGSCSVVLMIDGQSFNKPFTWNKTNKGQDAKSLTLVGNQIIRYEKPDYSDIPLQINTTVNAKVVGLSGTPTWSFYNGVEWVALENETAMDLTFAHNDATIWADRKEVTIKCELEGYHDELTIVKLANGSNGNDAITVILTNESHTVAIDDSGYVESSEIEKARTNVLAYKGANSVTPKITRGNCVGCDVSIAGNTVQLLSLDNSFTSSTAELLVDVNGVIITKIWTISKSKQGLQGESGQDGKSYILNVTDGTRSVTYSQINQDPRPSLSSTFNGALYEDGEEIVEGVSWYWIANGHFEGSSLDSNFTPTIKKVFDESVTNNSISVMATYNGQSLTQEIPLSVTKDAYGLDWVSEWDSTKVDVRGNLILTPKIFAGHYDQENDLITGVAIGQDVLNNGRSIGVVGYQNNVPSFLLDTDGSLQVGNPFDENATGLYYSDGVFKLRVNELSIEGSKVPTQNEIGSLVTSEVNSAKNELQETINGLNNSLGSLEDAVNNSLRDGILTEVERQTLKTVMDTLTNEMNTLLTQVGSVLTNPFLSNDTLMQQLQVSLEEYQNTYNTLLEIYVRIVSTDTPSDEDSVLFNDTMLQLSEKSEALNQLLIDCLTNISQTQAQQLVDKAKEEIQAEVSDVNDALTDLENTINTDFKAGLVTSINIANLENHLQQLAKEKADLDSQYNVIYNNANLSTTIKSKLLQAKSNYDIAHDTLVAKINSAIADNLMTEQELQEINALILAYAEKLGLYSGVAQEANADIALNSAQAVVEALDQEAIFNKLTNNGEVQGIYLQDGKVYINGEYVNTRNLRAVRNDGAETFKVDSEGNVSIKANSFHLVGTDTNLADKNYVDTAIGNANINLTQDKVFNALTNNGQTQGIYLENSKIYINGEYIKAKSISGDKISAGVITATNGKSTINLDNGAMNLGNTTDASYLQWTGSDLNIKAKNISIGSSSVATSSDVTSAVNTAVNNIQVGGTNLAYDTNKGATGWGWSIQTNNGKTITGETINGINCVKFTKDSTSGSGWSYVSYGRFKRDKITPSTTYVVSFEMKSNLSFNVASVNLMNGDSSNSLVKTITAIQNKVVANSTTWNKIIFELTTTDTLSTSTAQVIYITGIPYSANATHYFRNLKLEAGNKATQWSPAPEDIDSSVQEAITTSKEYTNSQIKSTKDAIELSVSNTYETKTNVTSKVNGAISTASNDATTKANNALSSAKSYADTKKTEAINSANNTLNTTIANYYTKSQTDSRINMTKDSINLSVSNLKTEVMSATFTNLLYNSDFNKVENDFPKHYTRTNATYVYNGGWLCPEGGKTIHVYTIGSGATWQGFYSHNVKVNKDQTMTASVYVATENKDAITGHLGMEIEWLNAENQRITVSHYSFNLDQNHEWKRVSVTGHAPEGSVYARVYCWNSNDGATWWGKPMLQIGSVCTAWNKGGDFESLDERLSNAEIKITDESITNVVKQSFYTKEETEGQITSKGYQTSSQVQQTVDALQLKFTQSGGYNLFLNSGFKKGTSYWSTHTHNSPTGGSIGTLTSGATWGFPDSTVNCVQIRLSNQSGKEYGITQAVKTTIGKKYTLSFYYAGHRLNQINAIVRNSNGSWLANKYVNTLPDGGNTNVGNWSKCNLTFTANATSHNINIVIVSAANDGYLWVAKPMVVEGELDLPYSPNPNEMYDGIIEMNRDGVTVKGSNGAYTNFNSTGMNSFNNSGQQTLGIRNGGITFHPYSSNQLGAYITQSALHGNSAAANGLAISTANNGTYISLGTSSLSDANTTLNMDQALTVSDNDNFQPKGINFWKDVHAHGYGIRQLSHLKLAGSGAIQFDYLNNSPSTIYEAVDGGHSLYVMGGYQTHIGCMDGQGTPKGVIWMQNSTNTHSYTHWNFHNYTMYNMKTATSYANTLSNRTTEVHGVNSNVDGIRYLYRDIELVDGKAVRSIPNAYKGCSYDIVSIVCKGKGNAWIENEDENKFEINGECRSVNVEVIIYPASDVMTISSVKCDEAPELTLPKNIEGEIAPMITN